MKGLKSRDEINLSRLLDKCQQMANNSPDLAAEWRLPKFLSSCQQMLDSLPRPPAASAPSSDSLAEYKNKIQLLQSVLPASPAEDELCEGEGDTVRAGGPDLASLPLPQGGAGLARDTASQQIFHKAAERQHEAARAALLGGAGAGGPTVSAPTLSLDKLLAEHRDQQERVAEEMIQLTRSLAEQSAAAGALVRQDTTRLEQSSQLADTNLERLGVESKRVGEFSARGNCRCWIWLMMVIVVLTFIGMVLMMRLFSKKVAVVEVPPAQSSIKAEL